MQQNNYKRKVSLKNMLSATLTSAQIWMGKGSKSATSSEQYVESVTNINLSSKGTKLRHTVWTICWIGY